MNLLALKPPLTLLQRTLRVSFTRRLLRVIHTFPRTELIS